jgi:hypothetical protein
MNREWECRSTESQIWTIVILTVTSDAGHPHSYWIWQKISDAKFIKLELILLGKYKLFKIFSFISKLAPLKIFSLVMFNLNIFVCPKANYLTVVICYSMLFCFKSTNRIIFHIARNNFVKQFMFDMKIQQMGFSGMHLSKFPFTIPKHSTFMKGSMIFSL